MTFKEEAPFTSEGISKIASAFDPKISALIVGKSKTDDKFSIWGGMFFGPSLNHFNSIPVALSSHIFSRPDVLMVTAKTAGSLTISRGHSQIGTISSGLFVRATPTPFIHKGLGGYVENIIKELKGYKTFGVHFYREYINALEYLLYQSSYRGHGSTIVILPCNLSSPPPLITKYSFSEKLGIENLIYESVNSKDLLQLAYIQKLSERLDFLAQLSVIDGALILSPDLEAVTFGATLNEPTPWRGSLITGPDGFSDGGELLALSKHGTRHNSAVQFTAVCKGCIVFVISQDGPIRAFTVKDDRTILCWPDCRNSMFI